MSTVKDPGAPLNVSEEAGAEQRAILEKVQELRIRWGVFSALNPKEVRLCHGLAYDINYAGVELADLLLLRSARILPGGIVTFTGVEDPTAQRTFSTPEEAAECILQWIVRDPNADNGSALQSLLNRCFDPEDSLKCAVAGLAQWALIEKRKKRVQ